MTLEELSVVFSAEIAPFESAVARVTSLLPGVSAAVDALAAHFEAAGLQAAYGLRSGLLSGKSAVTAAAKAVADAAAAALRGALQIHSPSKVTFQAGQYFDAGLLQGIENGVSLVENAAAGLGRNAADALISAPVSPSAPVGTAARGQENAENISITIPLEIDGYRLGVAAIEGINRVSRGTGRVELTL